MKSLFMWFTINSFKSNPGKLHVMVLGEKTCCKHISVINSRFVDVRDDVILTDITIGKKLSFSKHIDNLFDNVQYKLRTLRRIRKFINVVKVKLLGNSK